MAPIEQEGAPTATLPAGVANLPDAGQVHLTGFETAILAMRNGMVVWRRASPQVQLSIRPYKIEGVEPSWRIYQRTVGGGWFLWSATQRDIMADDWCWVP